MLLVGLMVLSVACDPVAGFHVANPCDVAVRARAFVFVHPRDRENLHDIK